MSPLLTDDCYILLSYNSIIGKLLTLQILALGPTHLRMGFSLFRQQNFPVVVIYGVVQFSWTAHKSPTLPTPAAATIIPRNHSPNSSHRFILYLFSVPNKGLLFKTPCRPSQWSRLTVVYLISGKWISLPNNIPCAYCLDVCLALTDRTLTWTDFVCFSFKTSDKLFWFS